VGRLRRIEARTDRQQIAMLMILQATCETTLQAFDAAGNPLDKDFALGLARIIARTQQEIDVLERPLRSVGDAAPDPLS
jgi:hypothetical protein